MPKCSRLVIFFAISISHARNAATNVEYITENHMLKFARHEAGSMNAQFSVTTQHWNKKGN